ncbi:MAG TPA: DUF1801 domain-containing protein [Isosphaeraceae bacterium]|nr:DUF1801 domain-containing protein [Isosphaeraceae bacterium]
MPIPSDLDEFLALYPPQVRDIALAARELVANTVPDATETVDRSARLIGFGYGPGYKDTICTLLMSRAGVKVGIARGSELPDPTHLLQGSGKVHRHVQLRTVADVSNPALMHLLEAALAAWRQRTTASR